MMHACGMKGAERHEEQMECGFGACSCVQWARHWRVRGRGAAESRAMLHSLGTDGISLVACMQADNP